MKLIKQSYQILEQKIPVRKLDDYSGSHFRDEYIKELYKHIEFCGRTCYRSEDKITEDSAIRFVNGLIKSKHLSVLEHGVIYLTIQHHTSDKLLNKLISKYLINPYTKVRSKIVKPDYVPLEEQKIGEPMHGIVNNYITTNYRVIIENGWEEDLQYLCVPTEYHEKRHTVLLHSCIHVYKDLTRHRKMSFSIESTRYVNYSKTDKFGEIKFVLPPWLTTMPEGDYHWNNQSYEWNPAWNEGDTEKEQYQYVTGEYYLTALEKIEEIYSSLIKEGWQPQQAAEILPQATAADVVMSGFSSDWEFIFRLRSDIAETGKPHPLVEELMTPLRDEFILRNYIYKLN